jgi:non-homologous end joining protein Ku
MRKYPTLPATTTPITKTTLQKIHCAFVAGYCTFRPRRCSDLASHIVNTKSGHFDPSQFEDRYESALIDLLKKKEAGEKIEPAKEGPAPRVVNLMDALRASVDAEKKKAPAPSIQARRPAKRKAGQK